MDLFEEEKSKKIQKQYRSLFKNFFHLTILSFHAIMKIQRWPRELNALQLQKTHANKHQQIKKTSSVWQQVVQMLTSQPNKETHYKW